MASRKEPGETKLKASEMKKLKVDAAYEFAAATEKLIAYLERTFPLANAEKIAEQEEPEHPQSDEEVLRKVDYMNLRGFLVEMREYVSMLTALVEHLRGQAAADAVEQARGDGEPAAERCVTLRASVDPASKLQDHRVLGLEDEAN